jgi:hypothetical protein
MRATQLLRNPCIDIDRSVSTTSGLRMSSLSANQQSMSETPDTTNKTSANKKAGRPTGFFKDKLVVA